MEFKTGMLIIPILSFFFISGNLVEAVPNLCQSAVANLTTVFSTNCSALNDLSSISNSEEYATQADTFCSSDCGTNLHEAFEVATEDCANHTNVLNELLFVGISYDYACLYDEDLGYCKPYLEALNYTLGSSDLDYTDTSDATYSILCNDCFSALIAAIRADIYSVPFPVLLTETQPMVDYIAENCAQYSPEGSGTDSGTTTTTTATSTATNTSGSENLFVQNTLFGGVLMTMLMNLVNLF